MNIILALLFVVALVSTILFVVFLWAKTWPKAPRIIISRNAKKHTVNGRVLFKPELDYEYAVDSKGFSSSSIFLGGGRSYSDEVSALSLWQDEKVNVSYCPLSPSLAYLVIDSRLLSGMPIIAVICAICIVFLVY